MNLIPFRKGLKIAAAGASLAVALSTVTAAPTTAGNHPPHGSLSITSYGAVANDDVDDLAAINGAVAAAKVSHKAVWIPEGTFLYGDLIWLDGVDMIGAGTSSVLKSTNAEKQAVVLTGQGASIKSVALTTVPVTVRLSTPESTRIWVHPEAAHYEIRDVLIDGGSSAGIIAFGDDGLITDNVVANTLADGIHITNGSTDVRVLNNTVRDTGDDQIAVVSYIGGYGGPVAKGITIARNDVSGGSARGITVSGGEDISIERNHVSNTGGAGIYIASEGSWNTYAVTNVRVIKNTLVAPNQNPGVPDKGGIRLQATNGSITGAVFEKNTIRNSGDSGILIVGSSPIQAFFSKNVISEPALYGIRIVCTVTGQIGFDKNTVTNSGLAPFSNASSADVVSDMPNDPDAGPCGSGDEVVAGDGTPVIDGSVDALWANSSPMQLNVDPNGTTGTARIVWDEANLYFLFEMVDSTPNAVGAYEGNDSVEVWVDQLNAKNGAWTVGDYHLRVDLLNNISTNTGMDLSGVQSAVTTGDGTYVVEFAVPHTVLDPQPGSVIGFNASANDDANGDGLRDAYLSWVDKNLPYWADTSVYGEVILIDQP